MTSVWAVIGIIEHDDDPADHTDAQRRAFATEDAAYAALGRLAVKYGAVGDLEVVELEVVGEPHARHTPDRAGG